MHAPSIPKNHACGWNDIEEVPKDAWTVCPKTTKNGVSKLSSSPPPSAVFLTSLIADHACVLIGDFNATSEPEQTVMWTSCEVIKLTCSRGELQKWKSSTLSMHPLLPGRAEATSNMLTVHVQTLGCRRWRVRPGTAVVTIPEGLEIISPIVLGTIIGRLTGTGSRAPGFGGAWLGVFAWVRRAVRHCCKIKRCQEGLSWDVIRRSWSCDDDQETDDTHKT